jgi:hypothetical protein
MGFIFSFVDTLDNGKAKEKQLPLPNPPLSTHIRPPCISVICLASDRPKPVPGVLAVIPPLT